MKILNINSRQQAIKVGEHKGEEMYVMKLDHYSTLDAEKVINYASETCCIPRGMLRASWEAISQVISSYVLQGHIVEIPGLGNVRAEVRAKAQKDVVDVSADDVYRRKIMLTPSIGIKRELNKTKLNITCFDKHGNIVKRKGNQEEE